MSSRSRLRALVAILFGALTAVLLGLFLEELERSGGTVRTVPMVVAARDVAAHTVIDDDMVKVAQIPESAAIPKLASTPSQVVGQRTVAPLAEGQPVFLHQLNPKDVDGHGRKIPEGMRLITLTVDEKLSIGYRLHPGDRVDVIRVYQDGRGWHAVLSAQAIEVFGLGSAQEKGLTTPRTVTLLVSPAQALLLSLMERENALHLVLRPAGDLSPVSPSPAHHLRDSGLN